MQEASTGLGIRLRHHLDAGINFVVAKQPFRRRWALPLRSRAMLGTARGAGGACPSGAEAPPQMGPEAS